MENNKDINTKEKYYQRFDPFSRFLHILIITSFLSLAITGMIIKFSGVGAFQAVSRFFGGYEVTGFVHRAAAVITFIYFILHIGQLIYKKKHSKEKLTIKTMFTSENTMLPRKRDFVEFIQTIKWFIGIGPRPEYGRWTYWEKFDYFAVFWGVAMIGGSGLLLWFPEVFTMIGIPGHIINIATIIHSDEALLAAGFIFTVHFYNTHFRPDKFPIDTVIFTGKMPLEEFKHDRPREYDIELSKGELDKKLSDPPPVWLDRVARLFGFTALSIGLFIVILIIYSMIFLYQ